MKPHSLGKFLKIVPLAFALIMTMACGKKNSVKGATPGVGTTVMGIPNLPGTTGAQVQQIISSYPCTQGGQRIPEIQLSTAGAAPGGNTTLISGPYNPGSIPGPVTTVFVGKSAFNDVMVVTMIANGTQVLGYNITVSMCSFISNNVPLIIPGRPLSNFMTPSGLVLSLNTTCGIGSAIGNVVMMAAAYQNYPQTQVQTIFAPVACGTTTGGYTGGGYTGGTGGYNGGTWWP
ncbi:MAG: hypothetical protein A2X86_14270 [Bdellovibrionales bacterium GWA2_49_15]|nr:MAG: hypothetical protein A2X86_14270 [Bdellovibrionales bacterium GWA2_49_15]HAZ14071.1 hypothetical protein [Bdellovibrionales bacterium]